MNTIYIAAGVMYSAELYHHGIKGQKWGVRRFDDESRYRPSAMNRIGMAAAKAKRISNAFNAVGGREAFNHISDRFNNARKNSQTKKNVRRSNKIGEKKPINKNGKNSGTSKARISKAVKIGASIAAAGLLAYGSYKIIKSGTLNSRDKDQRIAITNPETQVKKGIYNAPIIDIAEHVGKGKNVPEYFRRKR